MERNRETLSSLPDPSIRAIMDSIKEGFDSDNPPLALVKTYGCQQNENDSERICGMLSLMGYGFTDDMERADLVIYNTCAVRENAELKVFGKVGELSSYKRKKPSMIIALCGCMIQQSHIAEEIKKKYRHVDLVFGTFAAPRLPALLYEVMSSRRRVFDTGEKIDADAVEDMPVRRTDRYRAWVSIMYGCDNFCSYCVVPYVRGRERSRRPDKILEEIKGLVAQGVKDITLLGQNVNSYGKDMADGINFAGLLRLANDIKGDFRVRFMTSHPKDATDELFTAMAQCDKVVRHLHLPFQAGSDRILSLMNRRYTKEEYLELIERARGYMPGLSVTSDIIIGFPGEEEEDFSQTVEVVKKVRFDSLYTFQYSPRRGTPAAEMKEMVGKETMQRRFDELVDVQNAISKEINDALVGKTERVLVEGPSRNRPSMMTGRTDANKIVNFSCPPSFEGSFIEVKITGAKTWNLSGEPLLSDK